MIRILAFITLLVLTSSAAAIGNPLKIAQDSTVIVNGYVAIYSLDDPTVDPVIKKDTLICSGFLVTKTPKIDIIATAYHCTTPDKEQTMFGTLEEYMMPKRVIYHDGQSAKVEDLWQSDTSDIALLAVDKTLGHQAVKLQTHVSEGDPLFVYGAAGGVPWTYSAATSMNGESISYNMDYDARWLATYYLDCSSCYFGDSGGPVYNARGEAVGLFVAVAQEGGRDLYVSSKQIQHALHLALDAPAH